MKSIFSILFVVLAVGLGLSGCGNDVDNFLYRQDGRWETTVYSRATFEDGVMTDEIDVFAYPFTVFNQDGSGERQDGNGDAIVDLQLSWSFDEDANTVTITETIVDSSTDPVTLTWEVLESERDRQRWVYTETATTGTGDLRYELTWELRRAE